MTKRQARRIALNFAYQSLEADHDSGMLARFVEDVSEADEAKIVVEVDAIIQRLFQQRAALAEYP